MDSMSHASQQGLQIILSNQVLISLNRLFCWVVQIQTFLALWAPKYRLAPFYCREGSMADISKTLQLTHRSRRINSATSQERNLHFWIWDEPCLGIYCSSFNQVCFKWKLSAGRHWVVLRPIHSNSSNTAWDTGRIICTDLIPSNCKLVEHGVFRSSWSLNRAKSTSALSWFARAVLSETPCLILIETKWRGDRTQTESCRPVRKKKKKRLSWKALKNSAALRGSADNSVRDHNQPRSLYTDIWGNYNTNNSHLLFNLYTSVWEIGYKGWSKWEFVVPLLTCKGLHWD